MPMPETTDREKIVWSFFSGAMGLDLGLARTGLEPELAVEIEPLFCETIRRNRPGINVLERSISDLDADELTRLAGKKDVDLMVGGPPCQSFSPGGKRAALNDPRGNLIFEYLRLIAEVRPKRFVLENVSQLLTAAISHRPITERPGKSWNLSSYSRAAQPSLLSNGGPPPLSEDEQSGSAIRFLLKTALADLGYGIHFGVLNSGNFGAPQRRLRFVMVGDREGSPPDLPIPTHGAGLLPERTVRDAIADLEQDPGSGSEYTPGVKAIFDLVPMGGNWRDLPPDVARAAMGERSYAAGGGKTGFFRRLDWDRPSPTITGKPNRKGSALCHPVASRPLSVRECARIQGFPDDWQFAGSMNQQYLQIGNAVPVPLGEAIGRMCAAAGRQAPRASAEMLTDAIEVIRGAARNNRASRLASV
jgi:DNA (cytosine-5)-methyltransferase 1